MQYRSTNLSMMYVWQRASSILAHVDRLICQSRALRTWATEPFPKTHTLHQLNVFICRYSNSTPLVMVRYSYGGFTSNAVSRVSCCSRFHPRSYKDSAEEEHPSIKRNNDMLLALNYSWSTTGVIWYATVTYLHWNGIKWPLHFRRFIYWRIISRFFTFFFVYTQTSCKQFFQSFVYSLNQKQMFVLYSGYVTVSLGDLIR